jgi:CRP-like cAMP-binding protein
MQPLRQYLQTITPLSDADWEVIESRLQKRSFRKGEVLLREGQTCTEVFFILQGLIRLYVARDGKEICRQFFIENSFFSEYQSFLSQQPASTFVDVLEDTEVLSFTYQDMQHFYGVLPSFQLIGRKIAEQLFIKISERVNSFLTEPPEQRYQQLLSSRPKLIQRIPQYMIASYLGITPEHLSRLRRKRATS